MLWIYGLFHPKFFFLRATFFPLGFLKRLMRKKNILASLKLKAGCCYLSNLYTNLTRIHKLNLILLFSYISHKVVETLHIAIQFKTVWMNLRQLELLSLASLWPAPSNKIEEDVQQGTETEQDQCRDININHYFNTWW